MPILLVSVGVFASLLTATTIAPTIYLQILSLVFYIVSIFIVIRKVRIRLTRVNKLIMILLVTTFLPIIVSNISNGLGVEQIKTTLLIASVLIYFIVLPQIMSFYQFSTIVVFISSISSLLALLTIFLGEYNIMFINVYEPHFDAKFGNLTQIPRIQGFYVSSNRFGFLTAAGSVLSIYLYKSETLDEKMIPLIAFLLNLLGLGFSASRSSYLGVLVSISIYLIYETTKKQQISSIVSIIIVSAWIATISVIGLLPIWDGLPDSSFTHRIGIWRAAIDATLQRPLIGWGTTPTSTTLFNFLPEYLGRDFSAHNSYLRIFVMGGVIAGFSYSLLVSTMCHISSDITTLDDLFICMLVLMFSVIQIFEMPTMFGFSLASTILGIGFGYVYSNLYVDVIR